MAHSSRIWRRLKLRDLETLLAVAQWGSMAKAAVHLSVSQPAVSKAIADMEHVLGVRLLDRSAQGVEPSLLHRHVSAKDVGTVRGSHDSEELSMQAIRTIGFDIAKSVFQVHGVDAVGQVIVRRQLKRRQVLAFFQKLPPCLVGIEACASSHYWSRELQALGHRVRLMPAAYVKPYVKRQKNDMADVEAICEAVTRANMRFVPTNAFGLPRIMHSKLPWSPIHFFC